MARVLIATDDARLMANVEAAVVAAGHESVEAIDGQDAIERVLADAPDMAFLDAQLTVFSGLEACEALRGHPDVPRNLPIILLSDVRVEARQLEKAGITELFPKRFASVDVEDLLVRFLTPDRSGM